jgi:hypothetical protein
MSIFSRHVRDGAFAVGSGVALLTVVAIAQAGPVAAMFSDDQRRTGSHAASFDRVEVPATGTTTVPLQVYLSAGDLERAFDTEAFRPDAAIIPTNTDLAITAAAPATQRVLIDRVQKQPGVLRDLESQIAARRQQAPSTTTGEPGLLRIGVDSFVVQLSGGVPRAEGQSAFPKFACFVATDFAAGGAVNRRELFVQDRVRLGIAACLEALDGKSAHAVVLPLMGASSSQVQRNDAAFEGQRALRECRLINSAAGIALGIHDFAARRHNLRELGVLQWEQEIKEMFDVPPGSPEARSAQTAYRVYADEVQQAFRIGLNGQKTLAADLGGNCSAILDGR